MELKEIGKLKENFITPWIIVEDFLGCLKEMCVMKWVLDLFFRFRKKNSLDNYFCGRKFENPQVWGLQVVSHYNFTISLI